MPILIAASLMLRALVGGAQVQQSQRMVYPETKKVGQVDDYWGFKVADPYRWMEDLNSSELAEWVKQQNAVTAQYFSRLEMRAYFRNRITELWNYPKVS